MDNVEIVETTSLVYTKEEINKAYDYIKEQFKQVYGGCELVKLTYCGDDQLVKYQKKAETCGKEEVLVIEVQYHASDTLDIFKSLYTKLIEPGSFNKYNVYFVRNKNEAIQNLGGV